MPETVFPTFFKKLKEFIHTCTFYSRNTYKCAMTVFTILFFKKKLNENKKRKLRTLQGMIFDDFLDLWLPFGSLWSLLAPFGSLLDPFGPFWFPLVPFWLPLGGNNSGGIPQNTSSISEGTFTEKDPLLRISSSPTRPGAEPWLCQL